jgi:hypothetical protein
MPKARKGSNEKWARNLCDANSTPRRKVQTVNPKMCGSKKSTRETVVPKRHGRHSKILRLRAVAVFALKIK